jgi:hypothetical protein
MVCSAATSWGGVASATDLTASILEVLDTLGVLNLAIRVKLTQDDVYKLEGSHQYLAGDHILMITGLNLVQADPVLGDYIELEVAYD